MKINAKIYSRVTTEPFDTQDLENGVTIELHSLNQNEELYNEYAPKAKFALWTSQDGKNYRLLLEDGYYQEMRELYLKRVNQVWVNFWDDVEKGRGKIMKFIFLPLTIVIFAIVIVLMFLGDKLGNNGQLIAMAAVLVVFIVGNVFINKKIDKLINSSNNIAVEKIKGIIGHKRFDELMEAQRVYYDKFFGIEEEPAEEDKTPESIASTPEASTEELAQESNGEEVVVEKTEEDLKE